MTEPRFEIETAADDFPYLEDRLYEFNVRATGIDDGDWLSVLLRSADDEIRAGLGGSTWGGTLEIRQLWVHESLRGTGIGSALLHAGEAEALRRGCTQSLLSTFDFQAPAFYARHGYVQVALIENYPRGHRSFILLKALVASPAPVAEPGTCSTSSNSERTAD